MIVIESVCRPAEQGIIITRIVTVQTPGHIYILEFKLNQSAEAVLTQIKERDYTEKYALDPRPKILLGINFSRREKTVDGWLMEKYQS